jgi:hypothetical protein
MFVRREDAERFIEEVRGDDPVVAAKLRIEERELEAGRAELADPYRCAGDQANEPSFHGLRVRFR